VPRGVGERGLLLGLTVRKEKKTKKVSRGCRAIRKGKVKRRTEVNISKGIDRGADPGKKPTGGKERRGKKQSL